MFRGQYRISQENFSWMEGIRRGFSFAEGEVIFFPLNSEYKFRRPSWDNESIFSVLFVQVWARQRDFIHSHDGLNGYLIAIILSYLVAHEKVNSSMRPLQIFRVTLDFIGRFNFFFAKSFCITVINSLN